MLSFFCGCTGTYTKIKIVENYFLIATDVAEDLSLCYHESNDDSNYGIIIQPTVFAIGFDDNYIIAKQHPRIFTKFSDKKVTNFFILPRKRIFDWRTKNGLIGPLTENEFIKKRAELKIADEVKFTIENVELK